MNVLIYLEYILYHNSLNNEYFIIKLTEYLYYINIYRNNKMISISDQYGKNLGFYFLIFFFLKLI